jgi:hypothetical protein
MINLHNRVFVTVSNSKNGEVDENTFYHYRQVGEVITAEYHGGSILQGFILGKVEGEGFVLFYQHLNRDLEFRTGKCSSTPELLPNGRLRLHQKWQWTNGDLSKGESVVEEVGSFDKEKS